MISEIGKNRGFTLIEVLLSVAILAVGLVAVIGGYHTVLDAQKKADFISEGYLMLQQKIVDGRLEILSDDRLLGDKSGREGNWQWSLKVANTPLKNVYELGVEAVKKGDKQKLAVATYVRK